MIAFPLLFLVVRGTDHDACDEGHTGPQCDFCAEGYNNVAIWDGAPRTICVKECASGESFTLPVVYFDKQIDSACEKNRFQCQKITSGAYSWKPTSEMDCTAVVSALNQIDSLVETVGNLECSTEGYISFSDCGSAGIRCGDHNEWLFKTLVTCEEASEIYQMVVFKTHACSYRGAVDVEPSVNKTCICDAGYVGARCEECDTGFESLSGHICALVTTITTTTVSTVLTTKTKLKTIEWIIGIVSTSAVIVGMYGIWRWYKSQKSEAKEDMTF